MQPMKMTKLILPAAVAALFSVTAMSASTTYSVGFTTVPDIALAQIQAVDFGAGLDLTSGAVCALTIDDDGTPADFVGDDVMKLATAAPIAAGANSADITGAGCANASGTKGTIGIYEITGVPGGTVNVTVNSITAGTSFNFAPEGCVGSYNGAGDGDACSTFTADAPLAVTLASAADTVGNSAASGIPAPGVSRIAVGGSITTTSAHTAGQLLTEQFVIDVTY